MQSPRPPAAYSSCANLLVFKSENYIGILYWYLILKKILRYDQICDESRFPWSFSCRASLLITGIVIPYRIYVVAFKWRARSPIFYLSGRHTAALKIFTPPEGVHRVPRAGALNPPLFMAGTTTTDSRLFAEFRERTRGGVPLSQNLGKLKLEHATLRSGDRA